MSLPTYSECKDSGAPWLGVVPRHWSVRRLKNIFEIRKRIAGEVGHQVLSITQRGVKIKDIESNDGQLSMDYSKYQLVEPGDFAMNHMDLLTGYVDISPYAGVTSPDYRVFAIRDERDCEPRYFLYLLQNGYQQKIFYAFGQGSSEFGRWRFPTDEFKNFRFPFPPREEQSAIASFLDRETAKIDALIAEQEKLLTLLAEKRQATISHAVTKGLNPDAPMKDSGVAWLGEVPAHWTVTRMKHLIREGIAGPYGSSLTKSMYVASGYRVYGQQQVIPNDFSIGDYYISQDKFSEMTRYLVRPNDVLISVMGTIGRAALVPADAEPGIINPRLVLYRVKEALIAPKYLQVFINNPTSQKYFSLAAQGTTMEGLNMVSIGELGIPLPPLDEQQEILEFIVEETSHLDALNSEATRAIELLKERRTALISAAVTGQIDVRALA
ncbi:restriction endonuclease subunit S [Cognatazoarcus halotolerans]|uniref:restriction endonuclease subunit S n=1 Tax=Cognatazoarcus halotolerans TaxID=2686016 RepID=UPI00135BB22A|nr:restriction endonuclease subunit S [Cognatazoarcus halotolerans]MCP5310514.1 restriction endonuclease subunit S [Zoogloeaceae bacterium]